MRIIILGAGTAGRHLGANLCDAKHDVVMIDHDLEGLEETDRQLDALTIEGDGPSPAVLEKAGRSKASVLAGGHESKRIEYPRLYLCAFPRHKTYVCPRFKPGPHAQGLRSGPQSARRGPHRETTRRNAYERSQTSFACPEQPKSSISSMKN
jgi:hypothetical protein